jgi:tetraacyldisaccharide-1-P 4'-kinase
VVNELGLSINAEIRLPDHGLIDRQRLRDTAAASDAILTTAKDYWRDPAVFAGLPQPVFILPLTVTSVDTALAPVIKRLR